MHSRSSRETMLGGLDESSLPGPADLVHELLNDLVHRSINIYSSFANQWVIMRLGRNL